MRNHGPFSRKGSSTFRHPSWGCPRIAEQIALAFGVGIDKDVVRRILATHFRQESGAGGPSWRRCLARFCWWGQFSLQVFANGFRCWARPFAFSSLAWLL